MKKSKAHFFEDNNQVVVNVTVSKNCLEFENDGVIHKFEVVDDDVVYKKTGLIETVIVFKLGNETKFDYVIKLTNQKISGTIVTTAIKINEGISLEIKYVSNTLDLQKSGYLKLLFEENNVKWRN